VSADEFEDVRAQPDPLVRARLATRLIGLYQQRSTELARLRRVAIEQAAKEYGMSLAAVAAEIGLSKGRITQIRQSAPAPERAFFGTGPVTVAVPTRQMPGRALPVISAEDTLAAETITDVLVSLGFAVDQFRIPLDGQWTPTGDLVVICGPKSSPVTEAALAADPALDFTQDNGQWIIRERHSGRVHFSGLDVDPPEASDVAYFGRLRHGNANMLLIAGIHAIGSVGAVHYLSRHVTDLYENVGELSFSSIVKSTFDGLTILGSEFACLPQRHE
jgi:hypothetical protein